MHSMETLLLRLHSRIPRGLRLCLFRLVFEFFSKKEEEIPEWKPCDEESDWDGEEDHVCFSLFRNQAWQRHSIALQPDVCQPFVIWPQFVICCLWFCNSIRICYLWFCELYCNQNSLLTFRYRRIRMYMALIMTTGTRNWKNIENTVYLLKRHIVESCCKNLEYAFKKTGPND